MDLYSRNHKLLKYGPQDLLELLKLRQFKEPTSPAKKEFYYVSV